jgi:hypothetical protein
MGYTQYFPGSKFLLLLGLLSHARLQKVVQTSFTTSSSNPMQTLKNSWAWGNVSGALRLNEEDYWL